MCIWIFFLFVCSYCFRENRIGSLCLFVLKSISAMSFIPNQVKQCLQQFAQFNTGKQKKNCLVHTIEESKFFNSINYYHSFSNPSIGINVDLKIYDIHIFYQIKIDFTETNRANPFYLKHSVIESIFLAKFKNMLWILHAGKN